MIKMKHLLKLSLIATLFFLFGFNSKKSADLKINIKSASTLLDRGFVGLDGKKTILNSTDEHTLFISVNKRSINGKKVVGNSKVKRKGFEYTLELRVESKLGKRDIVRKRTFMLWNDHEIYDPYLVKAVDIGKYSLKLDVE